MQGATDAENEGRKLNPKGLGSFGGASNLQLILLSFRGWSPQTRSTYVPTNGT